MKRGAAADMSGGRNGVWMGGCALRATEEAASLSARCVRAVPLAGPQGRRVKAAEAGARYVLPRMMRGARVCGLAASGTART
jgi:hypothetical protein